VLFITVQSDPEKKVLIIASGEQMCRPVRTSQASTNDSNVKIKIYIKFCY